jgi:hypothetical protein
MSTRQLKTVIVLLVCLVLWLGWKYWSVSGQIMTANFVDHQFERCRLDVREAAGPERVLDSLSWSLTYYDGMTNALNRSRLGYLMRGIRDRTAAEAIQYLRKNTTNDYGDDPYKWVHHQ